MPKLGQAGIGWSSTGDTMTERMHVLAVPLRLVRPAHSQAVYRAQSLDRSTIEVNTIGSGVHEFIGQARYDHDPQSLLDLVKAGQQNLTLTYYPDLRDPGVTYACKLVSPLDADQLSIALDSDRATFGEGMVELRLRPTTSAPIPTLPLNSKLLFWYRAGDSLEAATFTRADTATYIAKGPGTITSAASGKARLTWWDSDSDAIRDLPALLLEVARTNGWTYSEDLSQSAWTKTNVTISADATTAPDDAMTMDRVVEAATTTHHAIERDFPALTDNTTTTFSFVVQRWSTRDYLRITTSDKAGTTADSWVNITTRAVGTVAAGHTIRLQKLKNKATRVAVTFDAASGVSTPHLVLALATADGASSTYLGSTSAGCYLWGLQVEVDKAFASSYIPTGAATDTRTADSLTFPYLARPQAMTIYVRCRLVNPGDSADRVFLALTNGTSGARVYVAITSASYKFVYTDGSTTRTATVSATPASDTLVEVRATLSAAGVGQVGYAVSGGTETLGSAASALTLPLTWASQHLMLNTAGGAGDNAAEYLNALVVRGSHTLGACRRLAGVT